MLYSSWFCWGAAFLCGFISLRIVKNIKSFLWSRLLARTICILSIIGILGMTHMLSEGLEGRKRECTTNLGVLSKSIITYSEKHNGEFPNPSKWCDLIIDEPNNKFESKNYSPNYLNLFCIERFRCPSAKETKSGYAFNKNLAGKRISEVDPNVIVVFETNAVGWNQNGGPEIMCSDRHKAIFGKSGSYVLCPNQYDVRFVPQSEVKNLRWNP